MWDDWSMAEMEAFYKKKLHEERSALKQKEEELKSFKDSMTEMEAFYKEKLHEERSALKQKEEELKSFKNRMAGGLAVSIKTGDTESMNNPVSKTRLTEMFDNLRLLQWPKIKDYLKSHDGNATYTKALIQKMFEDASNQMEQKKKQIDEVFGLIEPICGWTPQQVKEYRQLTIQNIQLALFHSRKEDFLKTYFSEYEDQVPQHGRMNCTHLAPECYWLGCLMALNNPPLQPDWENHCPGMDAWDIFPRDITSAADNCQRCEQQELQHKKSMTEMDAFYKEKLNEATAALKQKEEELKSFKNRVAGGLAVLIKTGDTESMNNPVSKTRLTEMYNELRVQQWPKIEDHLKSHDGNATYTKALIQKMFKDASNQMEQKKKQIDEVFGLIEASSGRTPQQVKEYRQLTVQNLQMALFHSGKEDVLKTYFSEYEDQVPQHVRVDFTHLAPECYWLGCLMALNNPPLQPDWENHCPGMDAWDIFPRDITSAADK